MRAYSTLYFDRCLFLYIHSKLMNTESLVTVSSLRSCSFMDHPSTRPLVDRPHVFVKWWKHLEHDYKTAHAERILKMSL